MLPETLSQLRLTTFDDELGRRIIETHIWAVREGLRGADAYHLFDGYCQRLVVDGTPLWRAYTSMQTLHPQWRGYGYTWRRDLNAIEPRQYAHGGQDEPSWVNSPLFSLINRARGGEADPSMRRRLEAGPDQRDFPVLEEFYGLGVTDYVAHLFIFGGGGDRSQGSGIVYSFSTDRRGGFSDDDTRLLQATLPAVSLAMKAHAAHVIASGLLGTYLGEDAGRRVHAGSVMRGSVDKLHAVIWYADIRGFTAVSDAAPGSVVVELLNDVFETLTASLRLHGGQVLKFIGDGMGDRPAGLHRHRPSRQRGCSDRSAVRAARAVHSRFVGVLHRDNRGRHPAGVARPPRPARREGAEGDLRAGSERGGRAHADVALERLAVIADRLDDAIGPVVGEAEISALNDRAFAI